MYYGHLHLISDLLQSMFKETYSLQKQLMELIDLISIGSASSEEDITDMVSGIHRFDTFLVLLSLFSIENLFEILKQVSECAYFLLS